jgi:phage gp29-like protein
MPRKNAQSKVSAERAKLFKLMFSNPISGLTPARLISRLNAWQRGEIRDAALLFQQIIERDDQVGPCANKRTRAVSRLTWQILPVDDSPAAEKHKTSLSHFYNNLTAFDGLNEMDRGGVRKLVKQMLTAIGMRYAMHEIIWKPAAPGGLTAEFKFLPLQFFENTTGRLRFLQADLAMYGSDLDEFFGPGGWMCTAGDGLMIACSIAYLFKTPTGLKAWVSFMEKFGMPGLHAETSAQKGTSEWDDLVAALAAYAEDFAMVTSQGTKINPIESKTGGNACRRTTRPWALSRRATISTCSARTTPRWSLRRSTNTSTRR